MSASKFVMAKKLQRVQLALMDEKISETSLDVLLPIIFEQCYKENLTFWFSFLEDCVVLNLRDVEHENYELNIRYTYPTARLGEDQFDHYKECVLINAFLITKKHEEVNSDKEIDIISGDGVVPQPIRVAIESLRKKGVPVTPEGIMNHLPLGEMSNNNRMQCNKYLKKMKEESQ